MPLSFKPHFYFTMKYIAALLTLTIVIGCSSDNSQGKAGKPNMITKFMEDTKSLEKEDPKKVMVHFREMAEALATKKQDINQSTIAGVLTDAHDYSSCIIMVEDHTIVKLTDLENCTDSGSWGVCMPYGEGYIKRGKLAFKKDHINNIIGRPDDQDRTAYFFE